MISNSNPFDKEDKHDTSNDDDSHESEDLDHPLNPEEEGIFKRDDEINLNNDFHCDNFGNGFENPNYNFNDHPQIVEYEPFESDKIIFESRVTKMNERYFSNNEEEELKDCDLLIEEEDSIEEPNKTGSTELKSDEKEMTFYDNCYWKSSIIPGQDILKDLDII